MRRCPSCGNQVEDNVVQCPQCGSFIKSPKRGATPPPQYVAPEESAAVEGVCPHCGASVSSSATICWRCNKILRRR
ncbi:MAG: zinc-ribbon domain-containing protein [Thermoplasmata archaeon]|nr:zinc-ribbon domain-containing protein [Thermoplasmata archaeon]